MMMLEPWYARPWAKYEPGRRSAFGIGIYLAAGTGFSILAVMSDRTPVRVGFLIAGSAQLFAGFTFLAAMRRKAVAVEPPRGPGGRG